MTKEEIRNYAISLLEPEVAKIEEAYNKGFEDGKKSVPASTPTVVDVEGVKFFDLGLPSGDLWSEQLKDENGDFLMLPYVEAVKYGIPTLEQMYELRRNCKLIDHKYIGSNGVEYDYNDGDYNWIDLGDIDDPQEYGVFDYGSGNTFAVKRKRFKGESHKVIIVKNKNDIK